MNTHEHIHIDETETTQTQTHIWNVNWWFLTKNKEVSGEGKHCKIKMINKHVCTVKTPSVREQAREGMSFEFNYVFIFLLLIIRIPTKKKQQI